MKTDAAGGAASREEREQLADSLALTVLCAAGGNGSLLVTKYGQVGSGEYLDPATGKVLTFNHVSRTWGEETDKRQVLSDEVEQLRASVNKAMEGYINDLYKPGKAAVAVYGADNGTITICLSAKNVNLSNYWSASSHALT